MTKSLPGQIAGIRLPDTAIARECAASMEAALPPYLFNHSVRSFVFSALANEARGVSFDGEIAFVAALMHDTGLVPAFQSAGERFEIDGADATHAFLDRHGVAPARSDLAWDAVALHACGAIPRRKAPEVAMLATGTSMDVVGLGLGVLDRAVVDEVVRVLPRLDFKNAIRAAFLAYARAKPLAQAFTLTDGLLRAHAPGVAPPTLEELIARAPFAE